jgi:hypothetical protein
MGWLALGLVALREDGADAGVQPGAADGLVETLVPHLRLLLAGGCERQTLPPGAPVLSGYDRVKALVRGDT